MASPLSPPSTCICDELIWEDIIGRNQPKILSPFSAIHKGASRGCHLCSLILGSLKTFDPWADYVELTDDCPCLTDPATTFFVAGVENCVQIQVGCGGERGRHLAVLQLTTMPHNRIVPFPSGQVPLLTF